MVTRLGVGTTVGRNGRDTVAGLLLGADLVVATRVRLLGLM